MYIKILSPHTSMPPPVFEGQSGCSHHSYVSPDKRGLVPYIRAVAQQKGYHFRGLFLGAEPGKLW